MNAPMISRVRELRGWRRITALLLLVAIPLTVVAGLFGASAAHAEGDDENVMKYSFYKMSSAMTSYFSSAQGPDVEEGKSLGADEDWQAVLANPGSAGSFLGYADPSFSDVTGWLSSKLSGSSDAIGYETLVLKDSDDNALPADQQGLVSYAYFGAALNGLGLDGTSTGLSLGFMNMIGGGIVMILYLLAGVVDFVFQAVIDMLALLNPFKLFLLGVQAASPQFADGMVGGDTSSLGALSGLASWIGGWYQALVSLSWTVMVRLFIAVFLVGLLLFKKMNRGGALKKILIRIAFLGLGLPLLGSMYTGTLTSMQAAVESGNAGSTRVVMSTYVDFESWAMRGRLAVPEDATIEWNSSTKSPSSEAQMNVRNTALAINAQTLGLKLDPILSNGSADSWSNAAIEGGATEFGLGTGSYEKTRDMLWRYMNGSQISASTFETEVKGSLADRSIPNATIKGWFDEAESGDGKGRKFTKDSDLKDMPAERIDSNPVIALEGDGGLRATGTSTYAFSTAGLDSSMCLTHLGTWMVLNDEAEPRSCNLSPLATYNYLNTDFGSTSMTMYSSGNVMSEATRAIHNSVNQVGTGTMSFLYWFNAVVLLGSFVLIGFGYAFSMVIANIRRSIQIMTAVPFATLGAMAGIAKVIVYSIALILQVVVTIFMYKLVQEFLVALPQIVEMPFSTVLNNGAAGDAAGFVAFLLNSTGFSLVTTIVSIIVIVAFTVMAMRARKSIVKAIEEVVTKLVEKFTDTSVGLPGGGGGKMMPALAGGLGAGAGAAAANRMISGGMAKGPKGAEMPGQGGPDGVGTSTVDAAPGGAGGTSGGSVSGEIETGDGTLGIEGGVDGPADGNGDPGGPLALPPGSEGGSASVETAEGKRVEAEGLTRDVEAPGQTGGAREAQAGEQPDAMDAASSSMEKSAEGYKEADKARLEGGKEAVKGVAKAGEAVARGYAGDAQGAAAAGAAAVQHGASAAASGERAKQVEADASASPLDRPSQKHARRAEALQGAGDAAGGIAAVAGQAGGKTGPSSSSASAPKPAASAAPAVQSGSAPKQSAPTRSAASAQPVQAPRTGQPKPQAAPRPQQPQQPVVNKSSSVTSSSDRRSRTVDEPRRPRLLMPPRKGKGKSRKG